MTNTNLIHLTQALPAKILKVRNRLRSGFSKSPTSRIPLIEDIDHFTGPEPKIRRALVTLSPEAWLSAVQQYPNIRLFNSFGLSFEIVRALNENGYIVDIVDFSREHIPTKCYDLLVAHGGKCRTILDHLPPQCPVLQYVSGVHWQTFNRESAERYASFEKRRGVSLPGGFRRAFTQEDTEGGEHLSSRTDAFFTIRCPRMVASYGHYRDKFVFTGYGAYIEPNMLIPLEQRQYETGKTNFIYVGGTGGNIQKGLDVILEAFADTPELHLFIYCKVEEEVLRHYQHELSRPNIHYIYHYRYPAFGNRMRKLMKTVNFTVHAPCNFGIGTAFMGSLGSGLIPVGYVDYAGPENSAVLAPTWQVESIKASIRSASGMSAEWCKKAASEAKGFYDENCTVAGFQKHFSELVRSYGSNSSAAGSEAFDSANQANLVQKPL